MFILKICLKTLLYQSCVNITVNGYDTIEQLLEKLSKERVKYNLNMLKNGNAPGDYNIVSDRLKERSWINLIS